MLDQMKRKHNACDRIGLDEELAARDGQPINASNVWPEWFSRCVVSKVISLCPLYQASYRLTRGWMALCRNQTRRVRVRV